MNQTTAPKTPSPHKEAAETTVGVDNISDNYRKDFLMAAMGMSWQLAIVVLVPIIGGFELDSRLGTTPFITLLGFVLAMAGMAAVVWRKMRLFSPTASGATHHGKGPTL